MGVRTPGGEAPEPGLIFIQIDGLSRKQFEHALEANRLPFLKRLIDRNHFTVETFYSGVPSTTPAVQAEIFFGVRAAVPSFQFLRRRAGRDFRMYEAASADEIENDLRERCPDPLLEGAHAYSDIYRAGASRTRYCSHDFGSEQLLRRLKPFKLFLLAILYLPKLLRMAGLAILEFALALADAFRGIIERGELLRELLFVPARIAVCVVLREMIRFRVLLDIERGVRVIQANFLGYDEQAHRRGPDSAFAHWSLKAIDSAIRDIYRAANDSRYRDYELMVYSDHGQEKATPYYVKHGRELAEAVQEVFDKGPLAGTPVWTRRMPEILGNTVDRCRALFGFAGKYVPSEVAPDPSKDIVLTAMGPVGHLYFPEVPDEGSMDSYARDLVSQAGIPWVMLRPSDDGTATVYNKKGRWLLPGDAWMVLGEHPLLDEVAADMVALAGHPDAGDIIFGGWDPDGDPLTFPMENGAHAGPGTEETQGFLLIPDRIRRWHISHLPGTRKRVRGEDLREIVRHYLGRDGEARNERIAEGVLVPREEVRVMTYNIHSCVGIDSKVRPERVARVINHFDPDIVAVQEVDCHRPRSGNHDQAAVIAEHLRMSHVFQAMLQEKEESYGIAIFSKHPIQVMKSGFLTEAGKGRLAEARGAIWVKLKTDGGTTFHFINTHFGLGKQERSIQMETLSGPKWIGSIPDDEPVVLCGDFNAGPNSRIFRGMSRLLDAQRVNAGLKPLATFSSVKPLLRLDHVFVSRHFEVKAVEVPRTPTSNVASDHLPVCVELSIRQS